MSGAAALFERERPRLVRVAYRMLGSVADAEEVVQAAWLRFAAADRADVAVPEAWLTRTVSRLALDALRAAKRRREVYVGPWLPEPIIADDGPEDGLVDAALMVALERLSPLERATFLLHDVFGLPFGEVADALGRDEAACRQLASRARRHVRDARPRFPVAAREHEALALAFHDASRSGDVAALKAMLAEDAVLLTDGGGVRTSGLRPFVGRDDVVSFYRSLVWRHGGGRQVPAAFAVIDGLPGLVTREADGLVQTTGLRLDGGAIAGIYVVRNPAKLAAADSFAARALPG